jgi:hypothetical protein
MRAALRAARFYSHDSSGVVALEEAAMPNAIVAGSIYFAVTFAIAFALGVLRVLVTAPRIGETMAVALELPVILLTSWFVCGYVLRRWRVRAFWRDRLLMGAWAFGLLMVEEAAFSVLVFGKSFAAYLAAFANPLALAGLLAQIAFGAFPLLRTASPDG